LKEKEDPEIFLKQPESVGGDQRKEAVGGDQRIEETGFPLTSHPFGVLKNLNSLKLEKHLGHSLYNSV
jgi:hypothetical protein